jgi:hypothetical protein
MGGASSAGALRDRSWRFFDTACSRNDDFDDLVPRRLREKLSVCDLLTFRLNIFGRYRYRTGRDYRRCPYFARSRDVSSDVVVKCCCRNRWIVDACCLELIQERRDEDLEGGMGCYIAAARPRGACNRQKHGLSRF